jgi:hypothetical protein
MRPSSIVKLAGLLVIGVVLPAAAMASGLVAARKKLFPYSHVKAALDARALTARRGVSTGDLIETSAVTLRASVSRWTYGAPILGTGGGGLTPLGDEVLGVDKWGKFFLYSGNGKVAPLNLSIETNIDHLRNLAKGTTEPAIDMANLIGKFRFLNIAARESYGRIEIVVSYYYWQPDERCKTVRVSRLAGSDRDELLGAATTIMSGEWELLFESKPCLEFSLGDISAFQSVRSGGALTFDADGSLLVTLGDHHLDGFNNEEIAAQDENSDYGKLIRINLDDLTAQHVAKGLRNSAIAVDRLGRIWSTDQGPKGGDELNLIRPGGNYGWPFVTLGTQYGEFTWELNARQGQHDGYDSPAYAWLPSIGPSNLVVVDGAPAEWDGDILVSALRGRTLYRLRVDDDRVIAAEPIPVGDRIRDVVQMRNGAILLWTDELRLIELAVEPVAHR